MAEVQDPKQFLDDFILTAEKAKKRIYIQTMLFESGDILHTLEKVLVKKAHEGLDIRLNKDWVSKRYVHENPNIIPPLKKSLREYNRQVHRKTEELTQRWIQAGITVTETNKPDPFSGLLSISGRNHIKMYLVDDHTAWLGGINLSDMSFGWIDFMVKFSDPELITALYKQFNQVNEHKPQDDYSVRCSSSHTLLIDSGKRSNSLIYDEAVRMIREARHTIIYASQFVPDGKSLQEALAAAKRGVSITIFTTNTEYRNFSTFPFNLPYLYFKKRIKHYKNISVHHQRTNVHAKLLIVDDKTALFGSHNLVNIGVWLATEEIGIRTEEKDLISQLRQFLMKHTKKL